MLRVGSVGFACDVKGLMINLYLVVIVKVCFDSWSEFSTCR